jgi:hypothetical protein
LLKIAGKPRGEVIDDSLLQRPVIPKAPDAPKIQTNARRDRETWSNAPAAHGPQAAPALTPESPLKTIPDAPSAPNHEVAPTDPSALDSPQEWVRRR